MWYRVSKIPPNCLGSWAAGPPFGTALDFLLRTLKTNVYVDAFNLYYGCLKNTKFRWLNIHALCQHELPSNTLNRIRVLAARVAARLHDLQQKGFHIPVVALHPCRDGKHPSLG